MLERGGSSSNRFYSLEKAATIYTSSRYLWGIKDRRRPESLHRSTLVPTRALSPQALEETLESELLRLFPGEVSVLATKVAVRRGLLEDGPTKVEITEEATRPKVEVVVNDLHNLLIRLAGAHLPRPKGIHVDGQWVGNTDRVRELNEDAVAQASMHERLGHPAACVGGGAIHLDWDGKAVHAT